MKSTKLFTDAQQKEIETILTNFRIIMNLMGRAGVLYSMDKQGLHYADIVEYAEKEIDNPWYVHGRSGKKTLNDFAEVTQDIEIGRQYAGKKGSIWKIRPTSKNKVLDLSNENTPDMDKLVRIGKKQFEKGTLPWDSDLPKDATAEDIEKEIRKSFSPEDIVDSAESYDDTVRVNWIAEEMDFPDFIKLPNDTGVAFNTKVLETIDITEDAKDPDYILNPKTKDKTEKQIALDAIALNPVSKLSLTKSVVEKGIGKSAADLIVEKKVPLTKDLFDQLSAREKAYSFTVSGVTDPDAMAKLTKSFQDSFDSGETYKDFQKRWSDVEDSLGLTKKAPYQIENIYRTNSSSAYSQGQWEQSQDPDIANYLWGFKYLCVGGKGGDGRNRKNHLAMAGFVARKDAPVWRIWWTPNGYNERCDIQNISTLEAKRNGYDTMYPNGEPPSVMPDEGFVGNKFVGAEIV